MSVFVTLTVSLDSDGFLSSSTNCIIPTSSSTLYVILSNVTLISTKQRISYVYHYNSFKK